MQRENRFLDAGPEARRPAVHPKELLFEPELVVRARPVPCRGSPRSSSPRRRTSRRNRPPAPPPPNWTNGTASVCSDAFTGISWEIVSASAAASSSLFAPRIRYFQRRTTG
jgi:hypothetical protein